jgi:hypothetical protein
VLAQTRDFAEYAKRLAQSALSVGGKTTREITGKVGVNKPQDLSATPQQDKLTLSKASIQNDGAEAALASAREADDAQNQLAELNKNLQDLEALVNGPPVKSSPKPMPMQSPTRKPPRNPKSRLHPGSRICKTTNSFGLGQVLCWP